MVASVNRTVLLESVLFLVLGHPRILQLLPLALKALLWSLLASTSGISYPSPMMEWPSNADDTQDPWILVLSHLEAEQKEFEAFPSTLGLEEWRKQGLGCLEPCGSEKLWN